ncbi:MAG TPA: M56 family metallopeptidase [Thermoanaerobaculia bacterium]|nr:M56 family metallopeptidase [Thermoanaerobaculia bacterium]
MTCIPSIFTFVAWVFQATAKGSVAILLIAVAERLIGRRLRARWRYALWLVIVLRLVVPVAPSSTWSVFNLVPAHPGIQWQLRGAPGQIVFQPQAGAGSASALPMIDVPWWIAGWKWVTAVWICGIVALAARALIGAARMQWVVKRALRQTEESGAVSAGTTRRIVDEIREQLGISRPVRVLESSIVEVPALHGVLRPTLLLPEGFSEAFDAAEQRHVILHELWHLSRHDIAINWLLTAIQALHWFNPFVWFAVSRIEEERELACDELTLSCLHEDERFGYGRTMLKLLERFRPAGSVPALVGIVSHKRKMRRRLMMIGSAGNRSPLTVVSLGVLAILCLTAFTDAPGERRATGRLDPDGVRTLERLGGRVTFDLTNGTLSDLLDKIADRSGVAMTQSPEIAASPAQRARFTLHAENVPAQAVLIQALAPFQLVPGPSANGVSITNGPLCVIHLNAAGGAACRGKPGGTIHRALNLSEGKLTIDVTGAR